MSQLIKIAIDPGQGGAIAIEYPDGTTVAHPFEDESTARDDIETVLEYDDAAEIRAVIERVHAMPKQGVSSTFRFGANYGFWRGLLQANRIAFREVTPQSWQKGLSLKSSLQGAERKRVLKQIAAERYPNLKVTLANADALLMLNYA